MARVRAKLRELQNATVNYISLVDRAATRIPFRVLKREEGEETLDLTKIFKSDHTPELVAVVVADPKEEALSEKIKQIVQKAGFTVDKVKKSEGVTAYEQKEETEGTQLIRLGEHVVLGVKGLQPLSEDFPEMVSSDGFFNGVSGAFYVVKKAVTELLAEARDAGKTSTEVTELLGDFSQYVGALVKSLPPTVFKAEAEIEKILKKEKVKPKVPSNDDPEEESSEEEDSAAEEGEEALPVKNKKSKKQEPAPLAPPVISSPVIENQEAVSNKEDFKQLLASVQSIATKVDTLSSQVNVVTQNQETQKQIVDNLVKKSDSLSEKFNTTVTAPPKSADPPQQVPVKKQEDTDPRTGCFDTAFFPRLSRR